MKNVFFLKKIFQVMNKIKQLRRQLGLKLGKKKKYETSDDEDDKSSSSA